MEGKFQDHKCNSLHLHPFEPNLVEATIRVPTGTLARVKSIVSARSPIYLALLGILVRALGKQFEGETAIVF